MNMLTTRETEIISALLLAEEIACKKAGAYSRTLFDGELTEKIKELESSHRQRFIKLKNMLG